MSSSTSADIAPALLERWMREYYFNVEVDIGSSGVQPYSMQELRDLGVVSNDDFEGIVFSDNPTLGRAARPC